MHWRTGGGFSHAKKKERERERKKEKEKEKKGEKSFKNEIISQI